MSKEKININMEKPKKIRPASKKAIDNLVKKGIGNKAPEWKDSIPGQKIEEKPSENTEDKTEKKEENIVDEKIDPTIEESKENKKISKRKIKPNDELIPTKEKKIKKTKKEPRTDNLEIIEQNIPENKEKTNEEKTEEKDSEKKQEIVTEKKEESWIEKLGYRELTNEINRIYTFGLIKKIHELEKIDKKQAEEELKKISAMEERAGYLLGNTEYFAGKSKLSEEEIKKECRDLKMAKGKLTSILETFRPEKKKEQIKNEKPKTAPTIETSGKEINEFLSYKGLIAKINNYIAEIENKVGKLDEKQIEEELKKMLELGNVAGEFLGNAWDNAQKSDLSDEEKLQFCEELRTARNKLRTLYAKLSFRNRPRVEKKDEEKQEITTEQKSETPSIDESLAEIAKNVEIPQSKESFKKKKAEIIDKILSERKQELEIKQPKQTEEDEQKISESTFEGFTSGEKIVEKNALEEINEKIGQKEQEIKEIKKRLDAYKLWGPWGKQTTGRDFNWYVDAGNLKTFKKELKKLEKERKQEIKQFKKYGGYNFGNIKVETGEKEITLIPRKKQGFFARLFGKKEKKVKSPKILTEKQLLKSVGKISKKRLREIIDEENKKGNS